MDGPDSSPPVSRYAKLVDLLMLFYWPDITERAFMLKTLSIAHKVIMRDVTSTDQEIEEQISGAMLTVWKREQYGNARGESIETALPAIKEYSHFYYQAIFQGMAESERALLQNRFRTLVRGCEAVYRERLKQRKESINAE